MAVSEAVNSRAGGLPLPPPVRSPTLSTFAWRRFDRDRLAIVGSVALGASVIVCVIVPLVVQQSAANRVDPTRFRAPPPAHPFGNDGVGRDSMWRTI